MELIEGETLANRLARGLIAIQEALHIATSICDALEAAHEKGIVHTKTACSGSFADGLRT
jgi:serine/threonine protein kinase